MVLSRSSGEELDKRSQKHLNFNVSRTDNCRRKKRGGCTQHHLFCWYKLVVLQIYTKARTTVKSFKEQDITPALDDTEGNVAS
jgi:hypothetical protein